MKLQLSQALATVLNIQIDEVNGRKAYVMGLVDLGYVGEVTLDQAIWKALENANLSSPSSFAVFPISSNREDYYMSIERELLRREQTPEFGGKSMWQMMSAGDPREIIDMIMLQIRECAQSIMNPVVFQQALLRTGCMIIASMQWTSDWIGRLKVRNATINKEAPETPKVVEFVPKTEPIEVSEPVPPLFGADAIKLVDPAPVPERKDDDRGDVDEYASQTRSRAFPEPTPKPKRKRSKRGKKGGK